MDMEVKSDGADKRLNNLVAVTVEDIRIRHRERDPEMAVPIDRRRADRRRDERQLALAGLTPRPRGRQAGDERVDLAPWIRRSNTNWPAASYFWNTGSSV